MKSVDAGTTMVLGAGIGSIIGIFLDNISMAMGIGAATGAILGGIVMHMNKKKNSKNTMNISEEQQ